MIKVLVVDDSAVAREFMTYLLSGDADLRVIGTASDGEEAVRAVRALQPDVIVMDVVMPRMDGLEATRAIMEATPTPIVVVSASWRRGEVDQTFRALEAGALTALEKPAGAAHPQHERLAKELLQVVKLMARVKVVKRTPKAPGTAPAGIAMHGGAAEVHGAAAAAPLRLVAMGASTGGPNAIREVLGGLPADFPAPVLIVQHIAPGVVRGFADWLTETTAREVALARDGERPLPGRVYVAPDGRQTGIGRDGRLALSDDAADAGLRPSVAHLFRSLAAVAGPDTAAVLLTGMGKDGAAEMKTLRERGALTIAQDAGSCVVYGMPAEAVALGAADLVLPPREIAAALTRRSRGKAPAPARRAAPAPKAQR